MNISSAVVRCKVAQKEEIIEFINSLPACEVHMHENEKIIITIEADDVNGELAAIRKLEQFNGIISVEMVYAFSEDELNDERDKLDLATDTPEVLNDDSVTAENIKYRGNLKKKL